MLENRLTVLKNENQEQKSNISAGQKECDQLREENQALLDWKKEKESVINHTEAMQKQLNDKIVTLEENLISVNEFSEKMKVTVVADFPSINKVRLRSLIVYLYISPFIRCSL